MNTTQNSTTEKITCPYCYITIGSMGGLGQHLKGVHKDKWKGNTGASLPKTWKGPKFKGTFYPRKPKNLPPVLTLEGEALTEPQKRYRKYKARYKELGLNAKGQPYKMSRKGRKNVIMAQIARRQRERGEIPHVPDQPDIKQEKPKPSRGHINHCPNCGYYIAPHELVIATMTL